MPHSPRNHKVVVKRKVTLATASMLAVLLMPVASYAQAVDDANRNAFLTSFTSSTTTTVVGGVILTIVVASGNASLERYLRNNAVALRQDITTGAGDTVEDLADAFSVEPANREEFGKLLRRHRSRLLDLADPARLDSERTRGFVELVSREIEKFGTI